MLSDENIDFQLSKVSNSSMEELCKVISCVTKISITSEVRQKLHDEGITLEILNLLDDNDLKEIGFNMASRRLLIQWIRAQSSISANYENIVTPKVMLTNKDIKIPINATTKIIAEQPQQANTLISGWPIEAILNKMTKTKIKGSELVDKLKRMEEINNKERIFLIKILGRYLMSNCKVTDRPSKEEKLQLCQALITAFPILRDNATSSGFEHFYDAKAHTGFLEMFIRQRRSRSDKIETLWSHSKKKDDVLLNSSEKVEQTLRELQPTTSNKESLLKMMADTRVVRRAWIQETSNLSITSIIRRFPRFIDMNDAIIQEFHSIEEASSNITLHDSFNTCKQNILLLARDLTMTNMFKYTLSEDEYNEEDTTLLAFKALPFLLKAPPQKGKKHPRMDPDAILALFYREMDVHFSLESSLELLKKEKVFQPILFKCCGSLFIKVDNTAIRLEAIPSISFAFELLLASYYVFNVNFPHELICVYGFLGSLLGISSKGIIVNSFLKKVLPKV